MRKIPNLVLVNAQAVDVSSAGSGDNNQTGLFEVINVDETQVSLQDTHEEQRLLQRSQMRGMV